MKKLISVETILQPRALDMILEYCLANEDEYISDHVIKVEVFNELNVDQIRYLLNEIYETTDEIAVININEHTATISANGMTQTFLDQGGFVKLDNDEKKAETELKERENIEFELTKSNIEANRLNIKNARFNRKPLEQILLSVLLTS